MWSESLFEFKYNMSYVDIHRCYVIRGFIWIQVHLKTFVCVCVYKVSAIIAVILSKEYSPLSPYSACPIYKRKKLKRNSFMVLRWKPLTISGRSDFWKVSWFSFYFKLQIWTGRTEIRVHIFIFQNANLAVQIFVKVYRFAFLIKIEIWTPFL